MGEPRRIYSWFDWLVPQRARFSRPPEANLSVSVDRQAREAEWRWHYINEESRKRGCGCGKPAQVATPFHEVVGTVPSLWWTCEDCQGCAGFIDGKPSFEHPVKCPLGETHGSQGKIGHPPDTFYCLHRTHAEGVGG